MRRDETRRGDAMRDETRLGGMRWDRIERERMGNDVSGSNG